MTQPSLEHIQEELIAITTQLIKESGEQVIGTVKLDASLQQHLRIDSLARAELFRRIEKKLNVQLPDRLLAEVETLNDIMQFLSDTPVATNNTVQQHHKVIFYDEYDNVDPGKAHTLIDVLYLYAEKAPTKPHVCFQCEDGTEEIITYADLLHHSLRVAASLHDYGLKEGDTVAIMQPTQLGFFYTFFGILLAGGVPVPIYPPFRAHLLEAYARTESTILNNAGVSILVTFDEAETLSRLLQAFVPSLRVVTTVQKLLRDKELNRPTKITSDHFAFIQYTSGSTSDPKGVLLSHFNLLSNIRAWGKAINVTSEDVAVSWLPLYHDFGLIGAWLGSFYHGIPLILMTPFSFLNHPERWLWTIHYHRGTITGGPNFAYELCIRKIDPSLLEGLDLSSLRIAANGAEKVYPGTLQQFANKFAPYGLKRSALLPSYGLAESTVALCLPPIDRDFRLDVIARKEFEEQRLALPTTELNTLTFVSCGFPLSGHEVQIIDDENNVLPERHVGNLQFRGPSCMRGYYNNSKATSAIFHDGWYDSGDLAYIAEGEIFITGRRKDLIIKAGRNLYPAELEELVGNIEGVRQGCVVAFGATDTLHATENLVIVAETRATEKNEREKIINAINEVIVTALDIVPDRVILVAPRVIPKTSSGKLQRAACKNMYLTNRLNKPLLPAWVQTVKLGLHWLGSKILSSIIQVGKLIFTSYVAILLLLSLIPMTLIIMTCSGKIVMRICRYWGRLILLLCGCSLRIKGMEHIFQNKPVIYACNHSSYLDALIACIIAPPTTYFVGKKELFSVPILRTLLHKINYLSVDRHDITKGLEDTKLMEQSVAAGHSIFIFPEGTFGFAAGLRPFHLGAFKVAVESSTPIVPIAFEGTRKILRGDKKLIRPGRVTVTVSAPISPQGKDWKNVTQLRNDVRAEIAKHCGEQSLDFIAAQQVVSDKSH